jgi:carboxypeptidase C (cathepsin A)
MTGETVLGALLLSALGTYALAADPTPHPIAVTRHTVHVNDTAIAYTATVAEDLIRDDKGAPGAAVVTITYIREGVRDPAHRPVMFAFNGGPGASSSPLHMSGMGPVVRERQGPKDRGGSAYAENTSSPLDVTDLVFIDPVSTGFSRPLPAVDPKQWYGAIADAVEAATVIKDWLTTHHREGSPKYLAGESYGATRAGLIVRYAPYLKFDGVILVSGGGSDEDPNARAVELLANMAVGAWYHKKVDRRGLTAQQYYEETLAFGRGDYYAALSNANLQPADLHRMAERVSAYIGLPVPLIEEKKLKVSSNDWMFNILKDQGLRAGLLDSRATGKWCPNMQGDIDDPSVGFVPSDTCAPADKPPPTAASVGPIESPAVGRYIRDDLRFADNDPYYGVNLTANSLWDWNEHEPSTVQMMSDAMKADPRLRLAVISGFYDLGSVSGATFATGGIPTDRLTVWRLAGGHEVYSTAFEGEQARVRFNEAVRKFVTMGR